MLPRKKHRRNGCLCGHRLQKGKYDKRNVGEQQREVFGVSEEKMNENYREYLKSYTRHYNRNKEVYGGKKITEEEAEDHETVREVKSYYEKMEGCHR